MLEPWFTIVFGIVQIAAIPVLTSLAAVPAGAGARDRAVTRERFGIVRRRFYFWTTLSVCIGPFIVIPIMDRTDAAFAIMTALGAAATLFGLYCVFYRGMERATEEFLDEQKVFSTRMNWMSALICLWLIRFEFEIEKSLKVILSGLH
jgi:hypothetical protein